MREIVVSYAAADADRARRVIDGLAALGFQVAEGALEDAAPKSLPRVVLWSRAAGPLTRPSLGGAPLVIARLDAAPPPAVRGAKRANLQNWRGRGDHRGWRSLVEEIAPLSVEAPAPASEPPAAEPPLTTLRAEASPEIGAAPEGSAPARSDEKKPTRPVAAWLGWTAALGAGLIAAAALFLGLSAA